MGTMEVLGTGGDVPSPHRLAELTSDELRALLDCKQVVALVPVGSVEPHGPHLPLATDTLISETAAELAVAALADDAVIALVAPPVNYGVTNYAAGFAGALSIPAETLTAMLRAIVTALLDTGFIHVCLVNNHLEPEHDQAVRNAIAGFPEGKASVACPLTRRWARILSPEFKSGACHAGRYETSLMLAAHPELVAPEADSLPALDISLSDGIREGKRTFREMGIQRAYTGAPAEATAEEGRELFERLVTMVVTEVHERGTWPG
jgi:creatinine amidohydrolase